MAGFITFLFLLLIGLVALGVFFIFKREKQISDVFKSLSFDVLEKTQRSFWDMAKHSFDREKEAAKMELLQRDKEFAGIVTPVKEALEKIEQHNKTLEKQRENAYLDLHKQIDHLVENERLLRKETMNLSSALKSPNVRGAWGQIHLKRVVELSGMLEYCDFFEELSIRSDEALYRPDLIVRLPNDRSIVIDAKTPIFSYLEASEEKEESKYKEKLQIFAKGVQKHIKDLSSKEYWKLLPTTPEYVILFLPSDAFLLAAMQHEPALLEKAVTQQVILATPSSLIAILRAISFSWKQDSISKNARQIAQAGKEVHERLLTVLSTLDKMKKSLTACVEQYNQFLGSCEGRLLPAAKKLRDLGAGSDKEMVSLSEITTLPRAVHLESAKEEKLGISSETLQD